MDNDPQPRAAYPHCDSLVLHAPGECTYCDYYPDWQAKRLLDGINFTGHNDPTKAPCPAEVRRAFGVLNKWPGNQAKHHQKANGCPKCGGTTAFHGTSLVCPDCGIVGGF